MFLQVDEIYMIPMYLTLYPLLLQKKKKKKVCFLKICASIAYLEINTADLVLLTS